jgi:transposase InsO family protein
VSERRACRAIDQPRSTQRYRAREDGFERRLVDRMLELVKGKPRYGYRRIGVLLRWEGWRVNHKRIYRLWRREGLKVPRRVRKKRRLGQSENGCSRFRAESPNHVWSWDFLHERTEDGRPLKLLTIVDEFTRRALAVKVARRIHHRDVIEVLIALFQIYGVPQYIRSDNGPELIAEALRRWLQRSAVQTLYVEPGAPWENGYSETLHSRLRDELLNGELFYCLQEAQVVVEEWRNEYNDRRPHSSLGYQTPAAFAARFQANSGAPPLRPPETPESVNMNPRLS